MVGPGQVLSSKYKLLRLLGEGGMGSVYEAEHLVLGTRVAVKILHPELARREGLIDRFLQEAMVAARIRSENVAHVMDVERTPDGVAFMVMELLEGESLADVLDRVRRLEEPVACDYARQILCALEAAHALGVVHRDLKPENVFVTYTGERAVLKLIDFGIAKLRREGAGAKNLTVAGVLMGTAEYMAPEQAYSADAVDARADLYAVGVMLYEMLAGSRPVSGDDGRVVALKIERGEIVPLVRALPGVKPELAGLVHRAMAFRRELRFGSAAEMRLALEAARASRTGALATARLPDLAPKPGTGTMLGAPLEGVAVRASEPPAPAWSPAAPAPEPRGTALAPVLTHPRGAVGHGPPPGHAYPSAPARYEPSTPPRARSSSGLVWGLVIGSVLLGAGIAAAVVLSGTSSSSGIATPPATVPPLPSSPPTPAEPKPTALPATPPLTQTPTLTPPSPQAPTPTPKPSTAPAPSGAPTGSGTSPTAPTLPSLTLPPMPSTMPSFQIPTAWPSSPFPTMPGFPLQPGPAPSGSSGY